MICVWTSVDWCLYSCMLKFQHCKKKLIAHSLRPRSCCGRSFSMHEVWIFARYFSFSIFFYTACDCYKLGSDGDTCNDNGRCICKDHFDGLQCDLLDYTYYDEQEPKRKYTCPSNCSYNTAIHFWNVFIPFQDELQ